MNYKAFLTGLTIGFVVALSPACGDDDIDGGGSTSCNKDSCSGCCDGNTCVTATSPTKCGSAGNACVGCTGNQVCNAGQCQAPTNNNNNNNNNTGGCSAATCAGGCCTASGNCVTGTTSSNCGKGGAACVACSGSDVCTAEQVCGAEEVLPQPDAGLVGLPCTTDSECQVDVGLGTTAICKKATSDGGEYKNGYCTKVCNGTPGSCPGGSECMQFSLSSGPLYGETQPICMRTCVDDGDCRGSGYLCYFDAEEPAQRTYSQCWIDLPAPQGQVGKDCQTSAECALPPTLGGCIPETSQQGPTGFTGGYCSANCFDNSYCGKNPLGEDNWCVRFGRDQTQPGSCLRACSNPGAVQGSSPCSTDEVCDAVSSLNPSVTVCLPACQANADCNSGAQCDGGYCIQ